jgi:transposase
MLYLAIDVHGKQLTVNVRNEAGETTVRRQVSTEWDRVRKFFADLAEQAAPEGGFVAILEVCGFHDWVVKLLAEHGCRETVLVQPDRRSKKKTDRRDAQSMGELLWVNRTRLLAGQSVQGLRRVHPPSEQDGENRQLTAVRQRAGRLQTRTLNKIRRLLLKHNLQQACPTQGIQTQGARTWLRQLPLPEIDRLEMDLLLDQWDLWRRQLASLHDEIVRRQQACPVAALVATMPGAGAFGSLALAARMDRIERFPRPESLANYWGLTPSCRNSGEATARLGSITKEGSQLARFLLGQMVLHVLRRDPAMKQWYGRIKRRRGSKIARVAVMRRLATILWHMVRRHEPYVVGGARQVAAIT